MSTGLVVQSSLKENVIEVDIPDFIVIVEKEYGYSLQCNKYIKKNDVIYTGVSYHISNDEKTYMLKVNFNDGKTLIFPNIGHVNSVKENNTTRSLYSFDSFMNHSCDSNTISSTTRETGEPNKFEYDQIAIKDINVGDEITCNYLHFDYECDGHSFECKCGCKNCYHYINGFKNCSLEQQIHFLPYVDVNMLEIFKADNPDIIFKETIPNKNVYISFGNQLGYELKSLKSFKSGDVVLKNNIEKISLDTKIILKVNDKYILLDPDIHFSRRETWYDFYGIDTFTNHSCNPNCLHVPINDTHYKMIAIKDIAENDEITCDYNDIFSEYDTKSFNCLCGEKSCRGIII